MTEGVVVMDPFASEQDMLDRTQGDISITTHPFLDRELAAASRTIRNACGWHIAPQLPDLTHRVISRWPAQVYLPAMRIFELQSVTVNGTAYDPALVEFDEDTGETNLYGRAVEVVFTAGFETVPEDLQQLTLEMAAGGLGMALGLSRETAGSLSVTFQRNSTAISPEDLPRIAAYRLGRLP